MRAWEYLCFLESAREICNCAKSSLFWKWTLDVLFLCPCIVDEFFCRMHGYSRLLWAHADGLSLLCFDVLIDRRDGAVLYWYFRG